MGLALIRRIAVGALFVSGVGAVPAFAGGPPAPITAQYRCDDGTGFVAVFDRASDSATVTFPGRAALTLPQTISGSGFRYSDGRYELRGKGDEGLWIVDGAIRLRCRAVAARH